MNTFALISVYDKTGIDTLAKTFEKVGIGIIATGGTAKFLKEKGIKVVPVEKITGKSEKFDGRIKTISFEILSGILFDRANKSHQLDVQKLKIPKIDFVVCNFYPFIQHPSIETIDIGGPTIVRAAAKNFDNVTVLVDPKDYKLFSSDLIKHQEVTIESRNFLAAKAFSYILSYDDGINKYFHSNGKRTDYSVLGDKGRALRYGENPHQKGYFFESPEDRDSLSIAKFRILQGKQPSYNNILDIHTGLEAICLIGNKEPACVIIKHTNPCGGAVAKNLKAAFYRAWYDGDALAAFGGIIVVNRKVTGDLAKFMLSRKKFFEILVAPKFDKKARIEFAKKINLQLWENPALAKPKLKNYEDFKKIRGGILVQDGDTNQLKKKDLKVVTKTRPTKKQIEDLLFAHKIAIVSKSNAITVVKNKILLSSGVGQQDRKRCCELCISKAQKGVRGAVAASDGFFPFVDGPEILTAAGIKAIIQPGGSIRDQKVIDFCNKKAVAMVFTNIRSFRH